MYLNDTVVILHWPRDCIIHLKRVSSLLQNAEVTFKLKKCNFFTRKVYYVDHVTRPRSPDVATHTRDAIKGRKHFSSIAKLPSLHDLSNGFQSFVPNFARIVAPLNNKLEKDQSKHLGTLTAEELRVMKDFQEELLSPSIFVLSKARGKYTLDSGG